MSSHDPSSSSTASDLKGTYDVFLSFRGEDTRKGFVSHLYTALVEKGIHTFRDDDRLERGKSIDIELPKAICDSKIAIVVFSKNYANSSWCLNELVQIVETKQVIPVFYDVDPSDISKQRNGVAEALANLGTVEERRMQSWKEALTKAANFSGYDVPKTANGNESECIRKIVADVLGKLNHRIPRTPKNVVGMEYRVNKVIKMLRVEEPNEVVMVGIWGMGGAGKTTTAQAAFDKLSYLFDGGSCFLPIPIDELSEKGLKDLQKTLLIEILKDDNIHISGTDHGANMIKERLQFKKVLIVLDNVGDRKQLTALAADNMSSFGPGSRLIVTTRDKQLLDSQSPMYNVELLNHTEAMELFNRKAFPTTEPHEDFVKLSNEVVKYAKGLPLALVVLGSHLHNKTTLKEWSSEIRRLRDIPHDDILKVLTFSYNGLDKTDKSIFLDVACFYRGWNVAFVTQILDSIGSYYERGIIGLERKSLVYVDMDDRIEMHDLVQEMGQNEAKLIRLWKEGEIIDALNEKQESKAVEGIVHRQLNYRAIVSFEGLKQMRELRLLVLRPSSLADQISGIVDMNLPLPGYLSDELELLEWRGYPWCSLPRSFEGKKLCVLTMSDGNIVEPIASGKKFENLKRLDLKGSRAIKKTPDFSQIPCLEELNMSWCMNLEEVHSSFINHQRLQLVDFSVCDNLRRFPKRLEMPSLKCLDLTICPLYNFLEIEGSALEELNLSSTKIRRIPDLSKVPCLKKLHLRCCHGLVEVLFGDHQKLQLVDLSHCSKLERLSEILHMESLKHLNLSWCKKLENFPEIEGNMTALEELNISGTGIKKLPDSVRKLSGLQKFHLHGCKSFGAGNTGRSLNMILNIIPGFSSILNSRLLNRAQQVENTSEVISNENTMVDSSDHSSEPIADLTFVTCKKKDDTTFSLPLSFHHLTLLNLEYCKLSSLAIPEGCLPSLQMLYLSGNWMHELLISDECLSSLKLLELSLIEFPIEKVVRQDVSLIYNDLREFTENPHIDWVVCQNPLNMNWRKMVSFIRYGPEKSAKVPHLDWETLAHKAKRAITILSAGNENEVLTRLLYCWFSNYFEAGKWFSHQISGFKRNIIQAPFQSWYKKRIRGFSIFLRNNFISSWDDDVWVDFCFHSSDESVNHGKDRYNLKSKGTLFHYQPIDNQWLNSEEIHETQEPICLFNAFINGDDSFKEVLNDVLQWEVRLVYEDRADHEFKYDNVVCEWSDRSEMLGSPVIYLQFMLSCRADFDEACSSRPNASMSSGGNVV